jgi:hypothetical protein
MKYLERGIPVENFENEIKERHFGMEFRVLNRITQTIKHFNNLFRSPSMDFRANNRYRTVLPCKINFDHIQLVRHNIVEFKETMLLPKSGDECKGSSSEGGADTNEEGKSEDFTSYINASYINVWLLIKNLDF